MHIFMLTFILHAALHTHTHTNSFTTGRWSKYVFAEQNINAQTTLSFSSLFILIDHTASLSFSVSVFYSPDLPRMQQLFSAGWQQRSHWRVKQYSNTLAFICTCVPLVMSSVMLAFGRATPTGRCVWGRGV